MIIGWRRVTVRASTYELRTLHVRRPRVTDLVIKFLFETLEFVSKTSDEWVALSLSRTELFGTSYDGVSDSVHVDISWWCRHVEAVTQSLQETHQLHTHTHTRTPCWHCEQYRRAVKMMRFIANRTCNTMATGSSRIRYSRVWHDPVIFRVIGPPVLSAANQNAWVGQLTPGPSDCIAAHYK